MFASRQPSEDFAQAWVEIERSCGLLLIDGKLAAAEAVLKRESRKLAKRAPPMEAWIRSRADYFRIMLRKDQGDLTGAIRAAGRCLRSRTLSPAQRLTAYSALADLLIERDDKVGARRVLDAAIRYGVAHRDRDVFPQVVKLERVDGLRTTRVNLQAIEMGRAALGLSRTDRAGDLPGLRAEVQRLWNAWPPKDS